MAEVSLAWGAGTLELKLPESWSLVQVAQSQMPRAAADWPDRLGRALNKPEGKPPLADLLRPWAAAAASCWCWRISPGTARWPSS